MAKKNIKQETLSDDEEMLMWTSYRYCVGRKTYVGSLASYIGKKYYNLLSDNRKQFTAKDIRNCIADCLRFHTPSFDYEGSVNENERNPISDYITWLNDNNITSSEQLYNIKKITCYKEGYNETYPKMFDVQKGDREWKHIYDSDINHLITWDDLASLFDVKNHVKVTVNYNDKITEYQCFEVWRHKYEPIEENSAFVKQIAWKWEKCYIPVDNYLNNGEYASTLNPKYITNVKKIINN